MDKSRRILLLLPDLTFGGAQRVLLQLAEAFVDAGREVHLASVLAAGPLRAAIPDSVRYHGLVADRGAGKMALLPQALPALRALLRTLAPDALLSSVTGTNLLASLARRSFDGRLVLREAAGRQNVRRPLQRWAMRILYPRADAWIAVSQGVARDLAGLGLRRAAIEVIPNPLDVDRLRALASAGPASPWLDKPYILSIGRLAPQKGHDVLLRAHALSRLRRSHRLLIVGDGPQRARLERLIRDLRLEGQAILVGESINPYPLLANAALFVLASRWEGYSNALLEALALGVPVVATDCPHGTAEILEGGRYGGLVAMDDPVALANALERESTQRSPCAEAVVAAHRMSAIVQRYLAVLDGDS